MSKRVGRKSASQTPAPKSERIYGSKVNPKDSAKSKESAKKIELSDKTIEALKNKIIEYNKENKNKVNLATLKAVYRRGAGAYSSSHRPTITGGAPNSRNAWAMARVNKFLKKKSGEAVKKAYVQDDDLLENGGVIDTLNPTSTIFTNYTPDERDTLTLGENIVFYYQTANIKSDEKVVVYRGVPNEVNEIRSGDFVTTNYQLAKDYAGTGKVIQKEVRADEILDDETEPLGEEYILRLKQKYNPDITYKDGGDIEDIHNFFFKNLAPNGEPSNLTPQQYELVRTLQFKAWFGDWENDPENASKVIDENGEPLVVWHGSRNIFNIFDLNESGQSNTLAKVGFWFTPIKQFAYNFARDSWWGKAKEPILYSLFLSIKNPKIFITDTEGKYPDSYQKFKTDVYKIAGQTEDEANIGGLGMMLNNSKETIKKYREKLKEENYDGIIIKQTRFDREEAGGINDQYLALYPEEIKLADGTNTIFDAENPDIRYDDGGKVMKAFQKNGYEYFYDIYQKQWILYPIDINGNRIEWDENDNPIESKYFNKKLELNYFLITNKKLADQTNTLLAPNGKPSNLTPEQYKLVRTPEFKAWFGDWENDPKNASKVLDKNGEPRVVYHGTNNNFTIFDKSKLGENNFFAESAYMGFFFAGNVKTSEAYIGMNTMDMSAISFGAYDDVISKYKSETESIEKDIRNVKEKYKKQQEGELEIQKRVLVDKFRSIVNEEEANSLADSFFENKIDWNKINKLADEENEINGNKKKYKDLTDKIFKEIEEKWKIMTNSNPRIISLFLNIKNPYIIDYADNEDIQLSKDITNAIKYKKDGIIFNNLKDGADVDDIFVAFESNQIKLADGTNTTFDPKNPDIRYDEGGQLGGQGGSQIGGQGSGVLLFCHETNRILLVKRSNLVTQPNTWSIVGGLKEEGEELEDCAKRECLEEIGYKIDSSIRPIYEYEDKTKFTTYLYCVREEFTPVLNWESIEYQWCEIDCMPSNLHYAFKIMMIDCELEQIFKDSIICESCGWSWDKKDTTPDDMYICHKCGNNNYDMKLKKPSTLDEIATKHKVSMDMLNAELENGIKHELEHTEDMKVAETIALHHLDETPDYYQQLEKLVIPNNKDIILENNSILENNNDIIFENNIVEEYEGLDYVKFQKAEAEELQDSDMGKLGKITICQAQIDLSLEKMGTSEGETKVIWNEVKNVWLDCMEKLKNNLSYQKNGVTYFKKGGLAYGNSHDKGGIPLVVKSTGQNIEIEGGEGVINKRSMQMSKKLEYEGKKLTPCEIISKINQMGGGVKFKCDDVKEIIEKDGDY
jgi:ADP-ribose pyrophosphatase YjhB (NUDIX family)